MNSHAEAERMSRIVLVLLILISQSCFSDDLLCDGKILTTQGHYKEITENGLGIFETADGTTIIFSFHECQVVVTKDKKE